MTITNQVLAQDVDISQLYNPAPKIPLTSKITDLLTQGGFNLVDFLFVIIGLIFFAMLVMAGWDYMLSSGDPKKVAAATTRLINALIGLVITVVAFLLVRLVTNMLGLGNLV